MTALDGVNGTACNAQQYQQSLQSHNSHSPWISCLTHGDIVGLILAAEASTLSCICVITIFIWIGWNIRWHMKTFPNGNWRLFQKPADIYMLSLLVLDLVQAIGGMHNIRWAHKGIVTTGHYCTTQGIVEQIGELGVALIILLLAVHTFVAAVLQVGVKARGVALGLVCIACVYIILWVSIGPGIHKHYETPTPDWCWISPQFPRERFVGQSVWLWIALFASAILYVPLYFWAEGFWSIDEGFKFHWRDPDLRVEYTQRRATLRILLYPLGYSVVVLPLTIPRYLQFGHVNIPTAVTFFGLTIFYLSGVVNVLLLLIVRPRLLLLLRPKDIGEKPRELTRVN